VFPQIKAVFDELGLKILSWPGNSPDLNPIENIWRLVGLKVNRLHPKNQRELQEAIIHAWNHELAPAVIHCLIDSMPDRISAVIKARGDSTKY
jgi:transposase